MPVQNTAFKLILSVAFTPCLLVHDVLHCIMY